MSCPSDRGLDCLKADTVRAATELVGETIGK
jgi:hypothetical protein